MKIRIKKFLFKNCAKKFSHPFGWERCFSLVKNPKVVLKFLKPPYALRNFLSYILLPNLCMSAAPFSLSEWNRQTDKFFIFFSSNTVLVGFLIKIFIILIFELVKKNWSENFFFCNFFKIPFYPKINFCRKNCQNYFFLFLFFRN